MNHINPFLPRYCNCQLFIFQSLEMCIQERECVYLSFHILYILIHTANHQSVGFLAPSVTPWQAAPQFGGTAINPSLRLYLYNKRTLLDYNQYHLNLSKLSNTLHKGDIVDSSHVSKEDVPTWELYYVASKIYGVTTLDYNNMSEVYEKLKANNSFFQEYYIMNSAGYNHGPCNSWCKKNQLCAIANLHIKDIEQCMMQSDVHEGLYKTVNLQGRGSFHLRPHGSSNFLIALVALSMILMVVLAITLAIMLVLLVVRKKQPLPARRNFPVTDLTLSHRGKKYSQLV